MDFKNVVHLNYHLLLVLEINYPKLKDGRMYDDDLQILENKIDLIFKVAIKTQSSINNIMCIWMWCMDE